MVGNRCKYLFNTTTQTTCSSAALLLLRLVAGIAFTIHGWPKIQNPFGWMGADASIPGFLQFLAALSEFGGGIAWIIGFLTNLFSAGIGFTMLVAVYFHMVVMKDPFINSRGGGSYELAAIYLTISILFLAVGPGKFSFDAKFCGSACGTTPQ